MSRTDVSGQRPGFSEVQPVPVRNIRTGESATLVRADAVEATDELVEQVTAICNEPLVYDTLFRPKLKGDPYPASMARGFLEGALAGWHERSHFVFLILCADGSLVGNVDLDTKEIDLGEIGYWATARVPGFVTPAVQALCDMARDAGYKALYAHTLPHNERSMSVLRRVGFRYVGNVGTPPDVVRKFVRALQ